MIVFLVLDLLAQHFLCGMDIMRVICAVHKDVDVVLPLVSCVHYWLWVLPRCQRSYVVNWFVYVYIRKYRVHTRYIILTYSATPDDGRIKPKHVLRKKGD
jgi:hypothetical protein